MRAPGRSEPRGGRRTTLPPLAGGAARARALLAPPRLPVAAAEAAIGLAILVVFFRNKGSIAVEDINIMKG